MKSPRKRPVLPAIITSIAVVLYGCQRDDPTDTALPSPEPAHQVTDSAWVDDDRIRNADAEPANWLTHGRTWAEQRHSPLTQINDGNVGDLGLAWYADLDTDRGQQATPIVVDGVMYSTSAWSKVQAVDAKTGRMLLMASSTSPLLPDGARSGAIFWAWS